MKILATDLYPGWTCPAADTTTGLETSGPLERLHACRLPVQQTFRHMHVNQGGKINKFINIFPSFKLYLVKRKYVSGQKDMRSVAIFYAFINSSN